MSHGGRERGGTHEIGVQSKIGMMFWKVLPLGMLFGAMLGLVDSGGGGGHH